MRIFTDISNRQNDFLSLCTHHHVRRLYAFGSSVSERFDEKSSDIDLLIELEEEDPVERGEKLISIWDSLEIFFQRKVDLLTNTSLRNPYLKRNIDSTKVLIYNQ
jgi:predicted nucleotidyltransferase